MNKTQQPVADLAIIGGGLAGSSILRSVVQKATQPLNLLIIDQHANFGGGMPYSAAMPLPFLLLDQAQYLGCPDFLAWIAHNSADLITQLQTETPTHINRVNKWAAGLCDAINQNEIGAWHLPRRMFGDYLRDQFGTTREQANQQGHQLEIEKSAVIAITRTADNRFWQIKRRDHDHEQSYQLAKQVVLTMGGIPRNEPPAWETHPSYIKSPYSERLPQLQSRLQTVLRDVPQGERRVIIKGANASAIEMIYTLYLSPSLLDLCDEIVVMSPRGLFPPADYASGLPPFVPQALRNLLDDDQPLTIQTIWQAYLHDHETAAAAGYTIRDAKNGIGALFETCLNSLSYPEKRQFVQRYGKPQKAMARRMSPHYVAMINELQQAGKLRLCAARINHVEPAEINSNGDVRWHIQAERTDHPAQSMHLSGAIFANCGGFSPLSQTGDPLWRHLLTADSPHHPPIASINTMDRGVIIDAQFQVAPALYALGPMLSGTITPPHFFWELMSIPRITQMSADVADALLTP